MLMNKGMLVVLSAPSGGGKDTVLGKIKEMGIVFDKTISATTRAIRDGEKDGVDYYFLSQSDFEEKIAKGEFLEYTNYNGNFYGTLKGEVENRVNKGGTVLLKIEVEGAANIRMAEPDCVSVFLIPPSMDELEKRLRNRGTETEDSFQRRFAIARQELARASEYDYVVVNDDLDLCAATVCNILEAEKTRYSRMAETVADILAK